MPRVPLRLTRRGWCALTALTVAVAALGLLVLSALVAGPEGLRPAGESDVVVRPGDTVWSIAAEVAGPGEDVRAVVDAIEELNDLEGAVVVPGQVLAVP
ncbi:LysM peptidoglycan-binding domain-containing protein [Blastococcus sp. SYSU D00695]